MNRHHDRQLSLITPTGHLTPGNLLGALHQMRDAAGECFYGVSTCMRSPPHTTRVTSHRSAARSRR